MPLFQVQPSGLPFIAQMNMGRFCSPAFCRASQRSISQGISIQRSSSGLGLMKVWRKKNSCGLIGAKVGWDVWFSWYDTVISLLSLNFTTVHVLFDSVKSDGNALLVSAYHINFGSLIEFRCGKKRRKFSYQTSFMDFGLSKIFYPHQLCITVVKLNETEWANDELTVQMVCYFPRNLSRRQVENYAP